MNTAKVFNPTQRIREVLTHLCNSRNHAYTGAMQAGHTIPNYEGKVKAIENIRLHLEHFTTASDMAHINLVLALQSDIMEILPTSPRFQNYRTNILNMIAWCNDHSNQNKQSA